MYIEWIDKILIPLTDMNNNYASLDIAEGISWSTVVYIKHTNCAGIQHLENVYKLLLEHEPKYYYFIILILKFNG